MCMKVQVDYLLINMVVLMPRSCYLGSLNSELDLTSNPK